MQSLYFQPAWDKTISAQDRTMIISHFEQTNHRMNQGIQLTFLREAYNHKSDLLITTFIHNFDVKPLKISQTNITYEKHRQKIATGIFDVPEIIPAKTSMPWTFIFSEQNMTKKSPTLIIYNK